jgi:putative oxidoreductase
MRLSPMQNTISWIIQIVVAIILFQTLFFKFTGAEESKYIFSRLGMEPWGRIGSGVVELIACILLLHPRTVTIGGILAMGVISGAIMSHLTRLGIVVINSDGTRDGGLLFALAMVVFIGSAVIVLLRRADIPLVGARLAMAGRVGGAA